jgi:2-desacetyl-2-hydroxyethyl bacteriochlorophyllide A dehydrogenase
MRAVALVEPGRVELVDDWPEPTYGDADVIVQMSAVGLCGTDLASFDGKVPPPRYPWILGHEGGGVIVAVGDGVRDRTIGQRVVVEPNTGCGRCAVCRGGRTSLCDDRVSLGFGVTGLLAERVAVPAEYTWVVPDELSDTSMACLEPLVVAHNAVRRSGVAPGDDVLVVGAGSVGQLIVQVLASVGATPHVRERHPGRLERAVALGASPAADDDRSFPHVFETTGVAAVFPGVLASICKGGTITLIGFMRDEVAFAPVDLVRRQITVRGHLIYDHPADFAATLVAVADGVLVAEEGVHAVYPIDDSVAAFAAVRDVPGKTVIDFSGWLSD